MEKVLIIDDDSLIRDLLADLILSEYEQVHIEHAEDGVIAQHKCKDQKYDLLILDHMMPNMDGSSFLSFLRKSEDLNKNTPIIMLTAFMPTISAEDEVNNKTFYLKKPIDFEKMLRFIKMAK